ncbi:hypothetical protein QR685DRAFT_538273 [Neurospora intermedia]|uniref:Uncharacterized protein n=1 Tax=Neurospora intermedia TaxID=5142 RepID=A0ABR3CYX0_NEUIN
MCGMSLFVPFVLTTSTSPFTLPLGLVRIPTTDVCWENITGTTRYNMAAGLHCSAAAPRDNLKFSDVEIEPLKREDQDAVPQYQE